MARMNTYDFDIICPFCGKHNDLAAEMGAKRRGTPPNDGDVLLCVGCAEFSMVDHSRQFNLRQPNEAEFTELQNSEYQIIRHTLKELLETGDKNAQKPISC